MGQRQVTTVETLRRELDLRYAQEMERGGHQVSDLLLELVLDRVEGEDSLPLFFHQMNESRKLKSSGRRGPSRSGGAAPNATGFNPPLNSMGVTKHETQTRSIKINSSTSALPCPKKIMGGYDGGFEAGFIGQWNPLKFTQLLNTLEEAKQAASEGKTDESYVTLAGRRFAVNAHGTNAGASYRYIIKGDGMRFLIHSNPKGDIQGIRVRYGFEALAGRDAFAVHAATLEWFKSLGFTVTKETVSRADFQVMDEIPMSDYVMAFAEKRVVMCAKHGDFHHEYGEITSYTAGSNIQICIYDKRLELVKSRDEVKMSIMLDDVLCGELPDDLTRVEFRLRREALKYMGINTVQDLLERENAIVDFLTSDWFRILKEPKHKGHTADQAMSPLWEKVRALFFEYFPGTAENRKDIDRKKPGRREIRCTADDLIKQAVGCLATAGALVKGTFASELQALSFVKEVIAEKVKTLFTRAYERVVELGIVRGVSAPGVMDWHLDPRLAGELPESLPPEFRVVYDEDLQYANFRKVAVAGCPF